MKRHASLAGIVVLLLLGALPASAQETRGSIEGTIKDSSGGVLPGVTVETKNAAGATVGTVTDAAGVYRFPALPPGQYELTANLGGFQPQRVQNVRIELGQILKIDLTMPVASVVESVQVTAESPIIDVKQNAASAVIQAEIIERIPHGRLFTSAITTAPGTNNEAKAGGLQIDGASGSENRYVIDGLDTTDLRNGTSRKNVLIDFIEEVQVKSSGYNAEYRATTGGVINAVTKSGTNVWHGDVGAYYDNDKWLGDVRPSLRLNPANQTLAEYTQTPRDPAYSVEPVVTVGGPIFRDKLWFYAGYIPQINRQVRTVTFNSNGQTRSFRSDSKTHHANFSVSSQVRNNMRLRFSGNNQRTTGGQSLPGKEPNGTSNSTFAQFPNPVTTNSMNDSFVGEMNWVKSRNLFINANLGYFVYNSWNVTKTEFQPNLRHTFSTSNFCNPAAVPGSSGCPFPDVPANLQQLSGYSDLASSDKQVRDKFDRLGTNLDVTYYANFKGQHTFRAGLQVERLGNDVLSGAQAPTVAINWNSSRITLDDPPRTVRGAYGYYTVARRYTEGNIHSNNVGFFFQDAWAVTNRLTLNVGVRADSERIPSYKPENPSLEFGFGDKIAPRAGFALDLKGDGRWKTYGSWGMFYDISKLEMPRGSWGAERWVDYHYTLDSFNWPSINCTGPVGSGCPGTFIELADRRHVSNDKDNFLVDPNIEPIRTQELTFGVDHELTRTMSVGVRYAHKWFDKTIEDIGIQVAGVGEVFMMANPGYGIAEFTLKATCPTCPAQPPAKRTYDGLEFRLRKRLSNNWSLTTNYVFSRIYGNYSGLSGSDENGRNSPSVLRVFDGLYMSFDQNGKPVYGRLQTDRPHVFKAEPTYQAPWGTGVGAQFFVESGTPQQSTVTIKSVPVFDQGRGNLGRTPAFTEANLFVWHDFRLRGRTRLNVGVTALNVFDQMKDTRLFQARYRDQLPLGDAQFFRGFDAATVAASNSAIRKDPRYTLIDQYQGARSVRVQFKLGF